MGYGIPNFSNALFLITETKFSPIISTEIKSIFPIPFSTKINILYHSLDTEKIEILLTDISGNNVYNRKFKATTNAQNIFVCDDMEQLSAGVYFLILHNNKTSFTHKIVKLQ
jgi:hypothetical protein